MNYLRRVSTVQLTVLALASTLLVIMQGAFVRVTGSGAGCGRHWPTCNGDVVPLSHTTESLIEFSHRLLSLVILLIGTWLVVRAFRERRENRSVWIFALVAYILLLNEALLGALTVLWGLTGDNASMARGLMVAAHLVNSLLLMGALAVTYFFAKHPAARVKWRGQLGLSTVLLVGILSMLLLMFSGGIAAMGNTMFAPAAESLREGLAHDLNPESHPLIRLRILHPVLGMTVGTYLLVLMGFVWWLKPADDVKRHCRWLAVVYFMQLAVGLATLVLRAPRVLQLLHLGVATVIFAQLSLLAVAALASPVRRSLLRTESVADGAVTPNINVEHAT
ncbi:MAG: COX15/CtaA family protein [Deinococcota bacterium]